MANHSVFLTTFSRSNSFCVITWKKNPRQIESLLTLMHTHSQFISKSSVIQLQNLFGSPRWCYLYHYLPTSGSHCLLTFGGKKLDSEDKRWFEMHFYSLPLYLLWIAKCQVQTQEFMGIDGTQGSHLKTCHFLILIILDKSYFKKPIQQWHSDCPLFYPKQEKNPSWLKAPSYTGRYTDTLSTRDKELRTKRSV